MYTLKIKKELPIAHALYRGAYSGLCCGNVYRDKGLCDGLADRYDLKDTVFPIIHGHNYNIFIEVSADELDCNGMIIDFKEYKKIINTYFDQYDHSLILTPDNPLCQAYIQNFKENNIDLERSRLFIWDTNPTAEYMCKYWYDILLEILKNRLNVKKLVITVEETSNNSCTYTE